MSKIFFCFIFLVCLIHQAPAAALTLSGEDLFSHPDLILYRNTPTIIGESLVFDEHRTYRWEKLFGLPILSTGQVLFNSPATTITVSLNLTRLTTDWDPYFILSDGINSMGAVISDNQLTFDYRFGTSWLYDFYDAGDIVIQQPIRPKVIIYDAGFPEIGESIDVNLVFILDDYQTMLDVAFLEGTGSGFHTSSIVIDRTKDIEFVMLGENISEKYQINSLTVSSPVPEPSTITLLVVGLLGVGGISRKLKNNLPRRN